MLIKNWLTKDLEIKIISLLMATLLWIYVKGEENAEIVFNLPLTLKNVPSNLVVTKISTDNVSINLRGQRNVIMGLTPNQVKIELDLRKVKIGENRYPLLDGNTISIPQGVEISRVIPRGW